MIGLPKIKESKYVCMMFVLTSFVSFLPVTSCVVWKKHSIWKIYYFEIAIYNNSKISISKNHWECQTSCSDSCNLQFQGWGFHSVDLQDLLEVHLNILDKLSKYRKINNQRTILKRTWKYLTIKMLFFRYASLPGHGRGLGSTGYRTGAKMF